MSIYIPTLPDESDDVDLFSGGFAAAHDPFQPFASAPSTSRPATPRKASLSSQRQHKASGSASSSSQDHPLPLSASQTRRPEAHAPLELGLYMVLESFFERAEHKIGDILSRPIDVEMYLPLILGEGVDAAFDKLLESMAFISKKLPRLVIDLVMRWRKTQGEGIDEAAVQRALVASPNPSGIRSTADVLNDRKSFSSIYILCRALSAIISAAGKDSLGDELGSKLEDIIYNSMRNADPVLVERSANRKANMEYYARIMGLLSTTRFISVSDRFIQDLVKINTGTLAKDEEARAEHLIRGMRYLNFKIYPLEQFEEAAEFLEALADVFEAANGARVKLAMASTLTALLEPIIATATAEVNHPLWARAIQSVHIKAMSMVSKPRYLTAALPLICAATAASPEDFLLAQFQSCLDLCMSKSKEKATRLSAFYGMLQLLWAYLRRSHETHTQIAKRLDPIIKFVFQPGRKPLNPPEVPLGLAACIPHFITHHHFEFGSEIIASLLNPQPQISTDRWPVEVLAYDKMHVAIRALLLTLDTLEKGKDPLMPPPPASDVDGSLHPPATDAEQLHCAVDSLSTAFAAKGHIKNLVSSASATIAKIAMACDRASDSFSVLEDRNVLARGPPPSLSSPEREFTQYKRHGAFMVVYPKDRQPLFDLLRICIDSWPRLLSPKSFVDSKPLDILLRALLHVDPDVYMSARKALERLTRQKDGHQVVKALGRFVIRPELVLRENGSFQGANTVKLESLVGLWTELVGLLAEQIQGFNAAHASLPATHHRQAAAAPEVEHTLDAVDPRTVSPIIAELEGVALVLICSQSALLRRRATEVLRKTVQLQQALAEWSNAVSGTPLASHDERLVDIMTAIGPALLSELDEETMTAGEKNRVQYWKKQPSKDLLAKIIDSEMMLDVGLFHQMLAPLFAYLSEHIQTPTYLARSFLAARLLKAYPAASAVANLVPTKVPQTPNTLKNGMSSPTHSFDVAFLADHFKTHLMVLCSIATNTGPASSAQAPEPGSHQLDVEKLNSGPDIVRLAVPFLASDNLPLREAVVRGLGCVNVTTYRSLLESLNSIMRHLVESPARSMVDPRAAVPRKSMRLSRLQLSVARVHELSSRLLRTNPLSDAEHGLVAQYIREALVLVRDMDGIEDSVSTALRRAFCVCVTNLVEQYGQNRNFKRCLPVEIRHQLFSLLDTWSFKPSGVASPEAARNGHRSMDSQSGHHHTKSRTSSMGSQSQNTAYEIFLPAVNALAALCEQDGIVVRKDHADKRSAIEPHDVLRWAQALFEASGSGGHSFARRAIGGLIACNLDNRPFLDATVYQSFAEPDSLQLNQSTFSVLSGALIAEQNIAVKSSTAISLALWKMGYADLPTRQRALDTITSKLQPEARERLVQSCEAAIYSTFGGSALQARTTICSALVSASTVEPKAVFLELAIRILQIGTKQTRSLMQLLPVWLSAVQLPQIDLADAAAVSIDSVMANLFLLSAKYNDVYQPEIRGMWLALVGTPSNDAKPSNLPAVLRFLIDESTSRGSKEFTRHAQKIVGCLCEGDLCSVILNHLGGLLQPAGVVLNPEDVKHDGSKPAARRTNLDTLFPVNSRRMLLAPTQAVLLLAGDAVIARLGTADPNILRFLHVLLLHVDHPTPFIKAQARDIIVRVLTLMQKLDRAQSYNSSSDAVRLAGPAEVLWTWRLFWEHDEQDLTRASRRTLTNMKRLVEDAIKLLEKRIPDVRRLWGIVALEWANTCPLRHIACRSFQAFRLLLPTVNQRMLAEMLSRLVSTFADDSADAQLYAREVLDTLACAADSAGSIEELPQLWWTVLACARTHQEAELEDTLHFASLLLNRMNAEPHCIDAVLACRPPALEEASKELLCDIIRRGFRSSVTLQATWDFVRTLMTAEAIFAVTAPADAFHLVYPATLLWGLQAMEASEITSDFEVLTDAIASVADGLEVPGLARVMRSLGKNRFRSKEDYIQQAMNGMREYYSAEDRVDTFVFFLGTLQNALPWVRLRCLALLKYFARQVSLQDANLDALGTDFLAPLMRLLFVPETASAALEVLDEPIPAGKNSGRDRAGSINSTSMNGRSGFQASHSIFGRASATGWSTSDASGDAEIARSRLRDVLATCGAPAATSDGGSPFAFAAEDPMPGPDGFFDLTAQSDKDDVSTLGDMVSALHDLGSFFEDDIVGPASAFRLSQSVGSASRVAAVLSRSHKSAHSSHGRTGSMAAIPETPTPFVAAFAENARANGSVNNLDDWDGFSHDTPRTSEEREEASLSGDDDSSFDMEQRRRKRMSRFWKSS